MSLTKPKQSSMVIKTNSKGAAYKKYHNRLTPIARLKTEHNDANQINQSVSKHRRVLSKIPAYTYFVHPGNNSELVKRILVFRPWWNQATDNPNLVWKPTGSGVQSVRGFNLKKKINNHIAQHNALTNKALLFTNMTKYCEKKNLSIEQFFPQTFVLAYNSPQSMKSFDEFLDLYELIQNNTNLRNLWIFKPSDLNRGRGICLIDNLNSLKNILLDQNEDFMKKTIKTNKVVAGELKEILMASSLGHIRKKEFILQKYIQNPLLINNRKFDIRVWVLIDHNRNYYFFKQGYLRLSSENYHLNAKSIQNKFIHLTNNAIQKYSDKYGQHEDGNQLPFSALRNRIKQNYPDVDFNQDIVRQMKQITIVTMNSVRKQLGLKSSLSFQILGYDFILDRSCNLYLLQINTNPCLQQSSHLLKVLVPRMLNDAFKLTIDEVFPPPMSLYTPGLEVTNYTRYQNMWQMLGNLKNEQQFSIS